LAAFLGRCRARAREAYFRKPTRPWLSVLLVAGVWLALLALVAWLVLRPFLRLHSSLTVCVYHV